MISVKHAGGDEWTVRVQGASLTHHRVRVTKADAGRYAEGRPVAELLEESFHFLLDREPDTPILSSFDLPVISRCFPEYEREIRRRLAQE